MVDVSLPNALKPSTCHHLYIHEMAATGTTIADIKKKKLTKVLSTKLSMDDYKVFRIITNQGYRSGAISKDSPSEMLRYMMTPVVDEFRKIPGFSLLKDKSC